MGWLILIALLPLLRALPGMGFIWLLAGGLFYSVGVIFYAMGDKVRHFHGIWHLFVLAGSCCHFFTILVYVA
jgi:hemolysin III